MGKISDLTDNQENNPEKQCLSEIYHQYYNDLYYYGLKITQDEELTKDGIQDLFISLWNSDIQLSDIKSMKFYLLKSLRRDLIRKLQKDKKKNKQDEAFSYHQPDFEFSHEEFMVNEQFIKERSELLTYLLNSLPKRQKEAIYLRYYEDLSYEEIAEMMSLNYQSVVNHIHKAFKTIREKGLLSLFIFLTIAFKHCM